MMILMIITAWIVAITLILPLFVLVLQCYIAQLPSSPIVFGSRRRVALLIPAHNEQSLIEQTLRQILPQLMGDDRCMVVADNCSDATAEIAKRVGAEVVVRCDSVCRGKGFALDAGVRALADDPPEVLIVLDADCTADPDTISRLSAAVDGCGRPVQALYLMRPPVLPGPESLISTFAFLTKNWVRPRAMQRLGLPVALTGTGMAFPWATIRDASLATGEIVEDLSLGLALTMQGSGPRFCETAGVWSELPSDPQVSVSQRTRWEHGYMRTMQKQIPRLLARGLMGRPQLICVAADLLVPPLSLLVLLSAVGVVLLMILGQATQHWWPLALLLSVGVLAAVGIVLSWYRFARQLVPPHAILRIPNYVFGKLSIYGRFIARRETHWVRTARDADKVCSSNAHTESKSLENKLPIRKQADEANIGRETK